MRIDRAKFLILAASLAPAGCVVTTHDEPVDTNPNASTGSGGSGENGGNSPGGATSGSGGSDEADGSAGMSSGGAPADDGGEPEPTVDGGTSDTGAAGAGGSGGTGGTGGSGGCDDSVGDPPACDTTNVCGNDWAIDLCNSGLTYMKPALAETYAFCVQSCEDPYACMDATLVGACPDPTTESDCSTIVAGCPNIQQADCEQYLSGLTAAGREDMVTCTALGDVFCDLYTCSESIGL